MKTTLLVLFLMSVVLIENVNASNIISVQSFSIRYGDTNRVYVTMQNDIAVSALNFSIKYDPAILKVLTINPAGRAVALSGSSSNQYQTDKISFLVYDQQAHAIQPDTGSIFQITFVAIDSTLKDTSTSIMFVEGIAADSGRTIIPFSYTNGAVTVTDVKDQRSIKSLPKTYVLFQNYPNPFNPTTTVKYALPSEARVRLKVYNILGQLVSTLVDDLQHQGFITVDWDANNLASGVYFYRLEATSTTRPYVNFIQVKKMLLVR